jgi:D-3-phosphoglycerate dehydrogenase
MTVEKKKILWAVSHLGEREIPFIRRLEEAGFEVVRNSLGRVYSEDELITALPGAFATVASVEPYTERVFQAARDLRVVARYGVGYEMIDVAAATRHGVVVAMAFGTNHETVADCTLALMAALVRNVVANHLRMKSGGWRSDTCLGLWRSTVGIIGLGRIGKAVARRCRGFEMEILAYDPVQDTAFAREHGVTFVPLETLLRRADIVTLHGPHTPLTENMINRDTLALMKPTAFLVNTARGGLVDEAALYEALTSGRIAGAALDVFKVEPPVNSPLLTLDNVILSPHVAGGDLPTEARVANRCIDSIIALARGENPGAEYLLNPEVLQPGGGGASGRRS